LFDYSLAFGKRMVQDKETLAAHNVNFSKLFFENLLSDEKKKKLKLSLDHSIHQLLSLTEKAKRIKSVFLSMKK